MSCRPSGARHLCGCSCSRGTTTHIAIRRVGYGFGSRAFPRVAPGKGVQVIDASYTRDSKLGAPSGSRELKRRSGGVVRGRAGPHDVRTCLGAQPPPSRRTLHTTRARRARDRCTRASVQLSWTCRSRKTMTVSCHPCQQMHPAPKHLPTSSWHSSRSHLTLLCMCTIVRAHDARALTDSVLCCHQPLVFAGWWQLLWQQ